jgi:4-aminobutyrate aminotransferase-like enzyme
MAEYNEDAYKLARKAYIEHSCPFERALLSCCVGCDRSRKLNLAEREAIACGDAAVREHCLAFYQALHGNAQFALKINPDAPWPFGKEIRAQCGGVRGLAAAMDGAADETTDIAATVLQASQQFGGCDAFPYSEIMRAVVHYEPRKRRP